MSESKPAPQQPTPDTEIRVSSDGTVKALSKWRSKTWEWRTLCAHPNSNGYLKVRVYRGGKRVNLLVHTLVARYFLPPRPSPNHEIRHLDSNKLHDDYRNLTWGTRKENAEDREREYAAKQLVWERQGGKFSKLISREVS